MRTNTFITRIKNIFNPNNINVIKPENPDNTNKPVHSSAISNPEPSAATLPLTPTVTTTPATIPISMAGSETGLIKKNDLGSWAMEQCIAMDGNREGMFSSLEIVITNYKLEAIANEEEQKAKMTVEINNINNEIISLNNKIANIREFHIPEKERQIRQLEEQMQALENNTNYGVQTDLGSETYTILATSKARTREIIRNLQTKMVELGTTIQQLENKINTIREQMDQINLFNKDVVIRRMNIFFNGWLKGLNGLGANPATIDETKSSFEKYSNLILSNFSFN